MRNTTIGDDYFAPFIFHIDLNSDMMANAKPQREKKRISRKTSKYSVCEELLNKRNKIEL